MLWGGPEVTSFHRGSSLERPSSIIYRGIYGSNRLSDSTKVTAGERQKIRLEKQKGYKCRELLTIFLGEKVFNFAPGFYPALPDL